jgi:hypothetical protein
VHLRRALLLFALVLGLTALAAAISPAPDTKDALPQAAVPSRPPFRDVEFAVRPAGNVKPAAKRARAGEHLLVSVAAPEGGEVTIPKLGLTESVALDAPATFDILAPSAGRYDVLFATSSLDEPRRVGTLVTVP